jgi:hypothetical protein
MFFKACGNDFAQFKILLTIIVVLTQRLIVSPSIIAIYIHTLSRLWIIAINIAGPFVGPNGITL